jgi:hypothetical protein
MNPAFRIRLNPTGIRHVFARMKMKFFSKPLRLASFALVLPSVAAAQNQAVGVTVSTDESAGNLADRFLGLSYESSMLLPKDGRYYFDARDAALVDTFKTLGIRSLRVGANAVDDPRVPVPQEEDIDALFRFSRVAGVKVIYSFRLKNGNPAESARLARYIATHYGDLLDGFAIGNEPNFYLKPYASFYAQWRLQYDSILRAVPGARFDGPSADGPYAVSLARDLAAGGHLAMASDHYYFIGSGREREKDPAASRAVFLSDLTHEGYQRDYAQAGAILAAQGVPYRIDELNSCYNGGAKDSSDTFASTLWALDCIHWWAAHHLLGMNFHTGESVGRDGGFAAPNYAAFLREPDGHGFYMRPQAYAYLAFTQGAHGSPRELTLQKASTLDFDAYAYQDHDGSFSVTLVNKSYGGRAQVSTVVVQVPAPRRAGTWTRMDLRQKDHDVSAKTDVMLDDASVDRDGHWAGQWRTIAGAGSGSLTVDVPAASATLLRFKPAL